MGGVPTKIDENKLSIVTKGGKPMVTNEGHQILVYRDGNGRKFYAQVDGRLCPIYPKME